MRILQVCSAREIGGGERHLADLANALAQRGHEVFAALSPNSPLREELAALSPANVIERPMRNALHLGTAVHLSRFVRENEIQIVHAHIARDYPLAALATGKSDARLVLTRHVLFPMNPIHRLTLRRTARVIAVSQAVAEALGARTIFSTEKITVIPNGIDVERFAQGRELRDPGDRKFRVGTIGHLAQIKGFDVFIRAAEIVCRECNDVEFVIVGEDKSASGENRREIEGLIEELELRDRVKLAGWVNDTAAVLPTFDLFVSAARAEPFGLTIIEAMAAGVPVIATASEGACEIIDPGETGILVPLNDVDLLASSIRELIDSADERRRLAKNAKIAARNRFSLPRMVDETERVYAEVLRAR